MTLSKRTGLIVLEGMIKPVVVRDVMPERFNRASSVMPGNQH